MTMVRAMLSTDIEAAAEVHRLAFVRQGLSREWMEANYRARPKTFCFVIEQPGSAQIGGYIFWTQKSGFRPEVVLELEQLAVRPDAQGQGLGRALIEQSLPLVKQCLAEQGSVLKHLIVTTRADNHAQHLYRKTLGAEVEAVIKNLYSADEVLMVAR